MVGLIVNVTFQIHWLPKDKTVQNRITLDVNVKVDLIPTTNSYSLALTMVLVSLPDAIILSMLIQNGRYIISSKLMEPSLGTSLPRSIPSSLGNSWKSIKTKSLLFPMQSDYYSH